MQFEFRAKSGKEQHLRLRDPLLARILHASEELPGQDLFRYVDDHGHVVRVNSADVNHYLRATTAEIFTAKDFRTWGGSVTAAEALVGFGPPRSPADAKKKILLAIDAAAARLNNTHGARASYPSAGAGFVGRETLLGAFAGAAADDHLSQAEVAVLGVVADEELTHVVEHRFSPPRRSRPRGSAPRSTTRSSPAERTAQLAPG